MSGQNKKSRSSRKKSTGQNTVPVGHSLPIPSASNTAVAATVMLSSVASATENNSHSSLSLPVSGVSTAVVETAADTDGTDIQKVRVGSEDSPPISVSPFDDGLVDQAIATGKALAAHSDLNTDNHSTSKRLSTESAIVSLDSAYPALKAAAEDIDFYTQLEGRGDYLSGPNIVGSEVDPFGVSRVDRDRDSTVRFSGIYSEAASPKPHPYEQRNINDSPTAMLSSAVSTGATAELITQLEDHDVWRDKFPDSGAAHADAVTTDRDAAGAGATAVAADTGKKGAWLVGVGMKEQAADVATETAAEATLMMEIIDPMPVHMSYLEIADALAQRLLQQWSAVTRMLPDWPSAVVISPGPDSTTTAADCDCSELLAGEQQSQQHGVVYSACVSAMAVSVLCLVMLPMQAYKALRRTTIWRLCAIMLRVAMLPFRFFLYAISVLVWLWMLPVRFALFVASELFQSLLQYITAFFNAATGANSSHQRIPHAPRGGHAQAQQ